MYGRVNNIPFDIVANGADHNEAAKQTTVEVAKNVLRIYIRQNQDLNLIRMILFQKTRMIIKTNFPICTLLLTRVEGRTMTNDA